MEKTYLQLNMVNALTIAFIIVTLFILSGMAVSILKQYTPVGN